MTNRWSAGVSARSSALDLEKGVFSWDDPRQIALSLQRSAERSDRRKGSAYQSAMSMLSFYTNRAGKNLSPERRKVLVATKNELRHLYGRS